MRQASRQSGMTLVELLVAVVIVGVVATGIYNIFRVHNLMAAKQDETTHMQQELLSIMVMMADGLRMCGLAPQGGSFGFVANSTSATSFFCTSDKNDNGALDANNTNPEHLGYRISGNRIEIFEPEGNAWTQTSEVFDSLQISYFNSNGIQFAPDATTINTIRFVEITATAIASPSRSHLPIGNRTMSTLVYCRNLGI